MNHNLGIRKHGLIVCFREFYKINNRYPETAVELSTVTSTILAEKNFQKYKKWFLDYIEGAV